MRRQYFDYRPRPQFRAFHRRKERFACIITHRRAGKAVACFHELQRRAIADVPRPVVVDEAEQVAEVVAVLVGEQRRRHVERHPVDDVLTAREAALGLPALPEVDGERLDRVERVDRAVE